MAQKYTTGKKLQILGMARQSEVGRLSDLANEIDARTGGAFDISFERTPPVFYPERTAPGSSLTNGEYGCYAAHVKAMRRCAQSKDDTDACLILERDATFAADPAAGHEVREVIEQVMDPKRSSEYALLGYCGGDPNHKSCTHAYAMTPHQATKLLNAIPPIGDTAAAIDHYTAKFCKGLGTDCLYTTCATDRRGYGNGCIQQNRTDEQFAVDSIHDQDNKTNA